MITEQRFHQVKHNITIPRLKFDILQYIFLYHLFIIDSECTFNYNTLLKKNIFYGLIFFFLSFFCVFVDKLKLDFSLLLLLLLLLSLSVAYRY